MRHFVSATYIPVLTFPPGGYVLNTVLDVEEMSKSWISNSPLDEISSHTHSHKVYAARYISRIVKPG